MTGFTTLTDKRQITIPAHIAAALDMQRGDKLFITLQNNKIVAEPVKSDFMSLAGSLNKYALKPTPKDIHKIERAAAIKAIAENAAQEGL